MRLDDGLADADHRRAADLVDVHGFLHDAEILFQHRRCELIGSVLIEHALELLHHIFDNALGALEKDVAGKAVSYYNVRRTGENARALDVADEIDAPIFVRLLQQCESLMLKLAALGVLGTDVQQADARVLAAHKFLGIEAAHIRKLKQIFRRALDVRAAVDEHDAVLPARKNRRHRRAADAADALDGQRRSGEERAGAARGDYCVALAVLEHRERDGHG